MAINGTSLIAFPFALSTPGQFDLNQPYIDRVTILDQPAALYLGGDFNTVCTQKFLLFLKLLASFHCHLFPPILLLLPLLPNLSQKMEWATQKLWWIQLTHGRFVDPYSSSIGKESQTP